MTDDKYTDIRSVEDIMERGMRPPKGERMEDWDPDTRDLVVHVKRAMAEGLEVPEIAVKLGFPRIDRLRNLIDRMIQAETISLQEKSKEQIYTELTINQMGCIRALENIAKDCIKINQAAGAMGAIKAKSEIYFKLLKVGQEMELIAKRPKQIQFLGRLDVRNMSTEDLQEHLDKERDSLFKLRKSIEKKAIIKEIAAKVIKTEAIGTPIICDEITAMRRSILAASKEQ